MQSRTKGNISQNKKTGCCTFELSPAAARFRSKMALRLLVYGTTSEKGSNKLEREEANAINSIQLNSRAEFRKRSRQAISTKSNRTLAPERKHESERRKVYRLPLRVCRLQAQFAIASSRCPTPVEARNIGTNGNAKESP